MNENFVPVVVRSLPLLRRWLLWALLLVLVFALLVTLIWLAGRYEVSRVQTLVDEDAVEATADIRAGLNRNVQSLQALFSDDSTPASWSREAAGLLRTRRELLRVEWRDTSMNTIAKVPTRFRPTVLSWVDGVSSRSDLALACATALRFSGPAYSHTYFIPWPDGQGIEVMELCVPLTVNGQHSGYLIAAYALTDVLANFITRRLTQNQEVSFTDGDGTRLSVHGLANRERRVFTGQHLLDLPGNALILRLDSWQGAPSLFPNVLTALVTAMSLALIMVLVMLTKDHRRRLQAERDLGDALAFRKAMEDSLVTGLRARDLQGGITYVNPAFCRMVGFTAPELLGHGSPAPYWPPENSLEYQRRQERRFAGNLPPREGFESEFMRKDGTRFLVLIIEAPLVNLQGVQTGWMSAFLDITEQRRVEELSRASHDRLQATARLATVGEMASLLSHELNQPLAAISSYATGSLNLLRQGLPGGNDMQIAMQRISEQAERAGRVIKSVHDFIRRRDQAREAVHPQKLLDAIMPLVSLQARKLGVQVITHMAVDLPDVLCDRTMVEQVLLNLARNAMQAMDGVAMPARILVFDVQQAASNERSSWLAFTVADAGHGIAEDVRSQLFTPFFTTKIEGMGLGLSLCRTVVEQHGGDLSHEPNQPQGTVFKFTLPTKKAGADHGTFS